MLPLMTAAVALTSALGPAAASPVGAPPADIVVPERRYEAVRAVDPIVIDGKADEETWKLAPKDDRFMERQPNLGAKPPVRTTVQVAYDDIALYVFIDAESKPGDVTVRTLRRDNDGIFSDDTISIKLDPTFNRRDGFLFGVNADGAQIDVLGLSDGAQFISEWDAVWSAETVRRNDGFTIEYRIPFAILGIKTADEATFGFNVSRDHPTRNATYDWRLFVPPRSPMSASQFGQITGLKNLHAQRALEFTPFVAARTDFRHAFTLDPTRRPNLATGGDMRLQVGGASYIEATLLTDFAQVQADEVQVAVDRFPLFFPERRPFFINGLDVFNFGRAQEAQLFFSRRVGLDAGAQVPILGGAKAYGRWGPIQYGVLDVQTLGTPAAPERGLEANKPANNAVGRIRVQATRALNVGVMMLGEHRFEETDTDSAAGGFDAQVIGLGGKLQSYSFVAGTWAQRPRVEPIVEEDSVVQPGRGPTSDVGSSASTSLQYRGLYVRPGLFWLWSDEDFDPRLGFYRRPGSSRQVANIDFAPRPNVLGIREIVFGPSFSVETTPDYDRRLTQTATSKAQINWRNGSALGYQIVHFIDDVQNPFELYLYEVEAGRYTGFRHRVNANTPGRRVLQANASYDYIELFGGLAHQPSLSLTARLGKHLTIAGRYTHLLGRLAEKSEDFNFGFANGNVDFAITRNLAFDNLVRLDLSPGRERFGLQSRLRWRYMPGSDLFVVYQTNQPIGIDPADMERDPFHEVTVKLTVYLRAFLAR
jgi:hypothetical protein